MKQEKKSSDHTTGAAGKPDSPAKLLAIFIYTTVLSQYWIFDFNVIIGKVQILETYLMPCRSHIVPDYFQY